MSVVVRCWYLGRVGYSRALQLQESLVHINRRRENKCPAHTILMLEHDPVYTVGVRTSLYAHDQEKLQKTGAQFVKTNRGGLITYHGPGQLTVYPIISLRGAEVLGKGIRWFVSALEQSGFDLCRGILGDRIVKGSILFPESVGATGVWFNKHNKILSIGKQTYALCECKVTMCCVSLNSKSNLSFLWLCKILYAFFLFFPNYSMILYT
uniref:Octanoyl-[acyl-carrier-protein]:protein N-octanoyltransferase LIPT2, mitochondrial n=1 Tax=Mesocestoides corti TaxID=53468 RepID=A0A5K3ER54_MESCO